MQATRSTRAEAGGAVLAALASILSACGGVPDASLAESTAPITFGQPDGTRHPYVGSVVYRFSSAQPWSSGCTGTLISPKVVATAAHCFWLYEGSQVGVTFDPVVGDAPSVIEGEFVMHPGFARDFSAWPMHDTAVVLLERPADGVRHALLPPLGLLDALAEAGLMVGRRFESVGYGVVEPADPANPIFDWSTIGTRRVSTSTFIDLAPLHLTLSNWDGGTCAFDSGGPNLFVGTDIVAGQTHDGDAWCRETNITFRLDTEDAQSFLRRYVEIARRLPVCHRGGRTLEIAVDAVPEHVRHGDSLGACP